MFTDGDKGSKNRFRRITSAKKKSSQNNDEEFADFYKNYDDSSKSSKESRKHSKKDNIKMDYDRLDIEPSDDDYQEEQVEYDYGDDTNYNEINKEERKRKRRKILLVISLALLLIIVAIVVVLLIKDPRIKLSESEMTLMVGESKYISFEVVNTEESIATTFSSENNDVATVDENGNVKAVGVGTTNIIVSYNVNSRKKKEKCKVTVKSDKEEETTTKKPDDVVQDTTTTTTTTAATTTTKPTNPQPTTGGSSSCDKEPSLSLSISNAQENVWTNQDIVININSSSNCGASVELKYSLDCTSNCNYIRISGNSATISNGGIHNVTIFAKDTKSNKEVSKSVITKIDKIPPRLKLRGSGASSLIYNTSTPITICADCADNESGCKQLVVCKTYSSSTKDKLTVMDNAGNTTDSQEFTVNY